MFKWLWKLEFIGKSPEELPLNQEQEKYTCYYLYSLFF